MKLWLGVGCAISLAAVAACNRGDEAAPTGNVGQAVENVASGQAGAQDFAAVMQERHDKYEEIGKAMKGIGDQLKSSSPSVEVIRGHADLIARYAPQVQTWFPEGSGPETGRKTRAKAEIWSDWETFRQRAVAFEGEAARFAQTAQSGDLEAIRAGQGALGKACKDCHDRFRGPEQD